MARSMEPSTLTMRAVAAELGVDPSAVNYHVTDRNTLLELVAEDVVLSQIDGARLPDEADWRDALRIFAARLRGAVIRSGSHSPYFRFPAGGAPHALGIVEDLSERLARAGMDADDTIRAVTAVNQITFAAAREAVLTADGRQHPQLAEMKRALGELDADGLRGARAVIERWEPGSDVQFEYNIELLIAGIEHRLAAAKPTSNTGPGRTAS
ncbi:TetR/AcrR family transcriptional regulator C-terminal domain-containing protein [Microbacterium aoyamense]|uniref:TetR/AcrR family transcriptional regulator C-terminal domain-containing protein n=1 Tax=Microbacterium aoyamense TaxID=344166 RepID=UPI0020040708|nr:TetR/AcrR family transcriptional regulator C-terminal domain-containing protein [Microbacterium aoyamense]